MKNLKFVRLGIIVLMLSFATASIMQDDMGNLGGIAIAGREVILECESWVTVDGQRVDLTCESYYQPPIQHGKIKLRGMDTQWVSQMTGLSVNRSGSRYEISFTMGGSYPGKVNVWGLNPKWGRDMRNLATSRNGDGWDITFMMWGATSPLG